MNTDSELWFAFAKTFGMLFVVLAMLLLAVYFFRRFSGMAGKKAGKEYIRVLAVHHLAPKEKLVLVNVMEENILIGVTPSKVSKIAVLGKDSGQSEVQGEGSVNENKHEGFSGLLEKTMSRPFSKGDSTKGSKG